MFFLSLKRLARHRLAMISLGILGFLYILAIFANLFAPYHYDYEKRNKAYHPPVKIHFIRNGRLAFPFVYEYKVEWRDYKRVWFEDKTKPYPIKLFFKGRLFGIENPAMLYLLGSDWNGRDILSRLIYGARISLSIGIIGVLISFSLGLLIGGISGYFGGWIDTAIMRFVELIMSFPAFYLLLSLRAIFPLDLPSCYVYIMIVIILSFIEWGGIARVIRGMVLSIREKEFILAEKAIGASSLRIIISHILPNTLSYAIVAACLSIPSYILSESALSMIGLGINEPFPSWGNMLSRAMDYSVLSSCFWILSPGFLIFICVLSFNLLSDGLRDAFDPRAVF
ncbi:MAG: ABC transporter permease [bacterium]